jgi:hypothetical protein
MSRVAQFLVVCLALLVYVNAQQLRILVAAGQGNLGRRIIREAHDRGHHVSSFLRHPTEGELIEEAHHYVRIRTCV